ncbi:MAG: hypothetical protein IJY25_00870 [Bacilli bacterium]|nr:hypothetical protein [Bacilli bacterium]
MENRGSKGLALAALLVGVVGLTIGFAAFSAQLTINATATTATPEESTAFDNVFGFAATPSNGKVDKEYDDVWYDIEVTFSGVSDEQTATHTIKNDSAYAANGVNLPTVLKVKSCAAADTNPASASIVTAACATVKDGTVDAPASIASKGTGTVTLTMYGPTVAVDGAIKITYEAVELDYTTAG